MFNDGELFFVYVAHVVAQPVEENRFIGWLGNYVKSIVRHAHLLGLDLCVASHRVAGYEHLFAALPAIVPNDVVELVDVGDVMHLRLAFHEEQFTGCGLDDDVYLVLVIIGAAAAEMYVKPYLLRHFPSLKE